MLVIVIANESDQSYSYSSERYDWEPEKKHQKETVRVEDVICLLREYGWTEQQ